MKKFILSLLLAIQILILPLSAIASTAHAQDSGTWYNPSYGEWSNKVFDPSNPNEIFGERYTYAQVLWIIHSLTAIVTGSNISECLAKGSVGEIGECMKKLQVTASIDGIPGIAFIGKSLLSTRPASGVEYVADTASKFHLIPVANAQGIGFSTLSPIQELWRAVRNISYLILIVIFIAMAFMIMFRVKISPQAVITVQSALPRLIIVLILITFSYAIAGLLIDLAYLSASLVAVAVKGAGVNIVDSSTDVVYIFNQLVQGNGMASIFIGLIAFAILLAIIGAAVTAIAGAAGFAGAIAIPVIGGTLGVGGVISGILILIIAIFILFILLRFVWLLLKTVTNTILLIIAGPIIILLGVLPSAGGFGGWIKALAANLAVYPVIFILVFLSHYFFWAMFASGEIGNFISLIGGLGFNTFHIQEVTGGTVSLPGAGMSTQTLGFIAALITLFLVPKAADIVQSLIQGKPFAFGSAIGEAIGPVYGLGQRGTLGYLGYESAKQQSEYGKLEEMRRRGEVDAISPDKERNRAIWNAIRGISGGRIR